jgi:hypothetical protein
MVVITWCADINEIPAFYTREPLGIDNLPDPGGAGHIDGQ